MIFQVLTSISPTGTAVAASGTVGRFNNNRILYYNNNPYLKSLSLCISNVFDIDHGMVKIRDAW